MKPWTQHWDWQADGAVLAILAGIAAVWASFFFLPGSAALLGYLVATVFTLLGLYVVWGILSGVV